MKNKSRKTLAIAVPLGLLEWAVRQRFRGDMQRAAEAMAGLSAEDFGEILKLSNRLRAVPAQTPAAATREKTETKNSQVIASKPGAAYGTDTMPTSMTLKPIETLEAPVNFRDELAIFHVSKRSGKYPIKLPKWLVAAGAGLEIQKCKDYLYFRELPDWKNHHSAEVVGESMMLTLRPRDMVILRLLNGSDGIALERLESEDQKGPMQRLRAYVPDRSICVLRINDEEPTLKRVHYQTGPTPMDWKLVILADNQAVWKPRSIGIKDHVVFYALAVGLAQE